MNCLKNEVAGTSIVYQHCPDCGRMFFVLRTPAEGIRPASFIEYEVHPTMEEKTALTLMELILSWRCKSCMRESFNTKSAWGPPPSPYE